MILRLWTSPFNVDRWQYWATSEYKYERKCNPQYQFKMNPIFYDFWQVSFYMLSKSSQESRILCQEDKGIFLSTIEMFMNRIFRLLKCDFWRNESDLKLFLIFYFEKRFDELRKDKKRDKDSSIKLKKNESVNSNSLSYPFE